MEAVSANSSPRFQVRTVTSTSALPCPGSTVAVKKGHSGNFFWCTSLRPYQHYVPENACMGTYQGSSVASHPSTEYWQSGHVALSLSDFVGV